MSKTRYAGRELNSQPATEDTLGPRKRPLSSSATDALLSPRMGNPPYSGLGVGRVGVGSME